MAKTRKPTALKIPQGPSSELILGDCVQVLRDMDRKEARPANLIIADAPYNFGHPYDKYLDNIPWSAYIEWTHKWLEAAYDMLHVHGSMFLFYPDELASFVDVFCQQELGLHKRGQIIWAYTFGVCNAAGKNFSRSHAHILYYTKTKTKFTFNGWEVAVPSARALRYNDKRANPKGKMPDDIWILRKEQMEEVFTPDQDTWLENRVCGTYKAREKDSPNQIPVPLLDRIVKAASNPGDLVTDPFSGSGSTGVSAATLGRDYIGIDVSKRYLANSRKRIDQAVGRALTKTGF